MSLQELADKIRDQVDVNFSRKVRPDHRHLHDVAVGVAGVLGMPADFFNTGHLMGLLEAHAEPPRYPKMKFHHGDKRHLIVHSANEERALGDEWLDERWEGRENAPS